MSKKTLFFLLSLLNIISIFCIQSDYIITLKNDFSIREHKKHGYSVFNHVKKTIEIDTEESDINLFKIYQSSSEEISNFRADNYNRYSEVKTYWEHVNNPNIFLHDTKVHYAFFDEGFRKGDVVHLDYDVEYNSINEIPIMIIPGN